MKRIINGLRYDTETAECLADEVRSLHNFFQTSEALYVTKSGRYFLHGESSAGGKYTRYLEGGRTQTSGDAIVPLTPEKAREWAEAADIGTDEQEAIYQDLTVRGHATVEEA